MKSAAASPAASTIRWAAATDTTGMAKNVWVVTAVSMGITNVDVLDKSGVSVHTIRVSVTANPPTETTTEPTTPAEPTEPTTPVDDTITISGKKGVEVDLTKHLAGGAGAVPLTCAGRPWRRLQVGSDGALFGCYGRRVVGNHP